MARENFKILIADDDLDDQTLIKSGLEKCIVKLEIDAVYDGNQVVDYLLRRNAYQGLAALPDLVLMDLNMPVMDGFSVLREIRNHKHLKNLPIYVITTSRSIDDWNKALDLGANGFYSKGSSSKDINRIMREVCADCFEKTESGK